MLRFLATRIAAGAVQLLLLLVLVFVAVRLAGDPADVLLPVTASPEEAQQISEALGLDKSIPVQFGRYLRNLARGDFGRTFKTNQPVGPLVLNRLANSAKLALAAAIVVLLWAVPIGVLAAKYVGTSVDTGLTTTAVVGLAVPNFFLGILLVRIFSVDLGWLPTSGMGSLAHYVLPAIALGTGIGAGAMRLMRSGMLDVREEPFIRTAAAKGMSPWVVTWRHQFRAGVMPLLTYSGMYFATLLGGSVVVEVVFAWPGMGRLAYESTLGRDFPVLQAIVLLLGVVIIVANSLVDAAYAYVESQVAVEPAMSDVGTIEELSAESPSRKRWRKALRRAPKFSIAIAFVFVGCALFATFLPLADPNAISLGDRLQPPWWAAAGTPAHLLGTDSLGRDVLSRLVHGARISALLGLFVICVAAVIGSTIGLISGYFGGLTDLVITRLIDASLTIPTIFAVLVLVVVLGPGFTSLTLALVIFLWARFARVVRGEALRYREKDFVKRAIVVGGSTTRVILMHVAPNLFDTVLVLATINFGYVIIAEASISFLGLGLPPPTATWGQMVSDGRNYLRDAWWLSMIPGAAIVFVVLALSRIGDWIRAELDPFSERV